MNSLLILENDLMENCKPCSLVFEDRDYPVLFGKDTSQKLTTPKELSLDELETVTAGAMTWEGVALGATTLSLAAGSAAAFPGTWAVPGAGPAMVLTMATMGGVAAMASYFSSKASCK
jgi:hypothetical protein